MRLIVVSTVLSLAAPLSAQSLLFRSPNLAGTWVPEPGVVQFNFLHRFYVSPAPTKSVQNFPTFTVAVGLPAAEEIHILTGFALLRHSVTPVEQTTFGKWVSW